MTPSAHPRLVLPFLLALSLFLPSCRKKTPGTVAYLPAADEDQTVLQSAQTQSIQSDAAKRGLTLLIAQRSPSADGQRNALRAFIAHRVNAIILSPQEPLGWDFVLDEAKRASIPVVLVNRPLSPDTDAGLYATLITSDYVEQGRRAARWLADHTPPDKSLNILELEAPAGSAPARGRKQGFDDEIARHPNLHVLAHEPANAGRDQARQITARYLAPTGSQSINAIFAHNDASALGAADAIQAAGKRPGHDILILSIEATRTALQALLDKRLNCVIESNPLLGPDALDAIDAVSKGRFVPRHLTMKDAVFDQSNITKEIIADRKY